MNLHGYFKDKGYVEEHIFPDEYTLLVDPQTLKRVRLYEDGRVWVQDDNGRYNRVEAPEKEEE